MSDSPELATWEEAVVWLRAQPDKQQLVLDAFYDDPLVTSAERYSQSSEWKEISRLLSGRRGSALDVGAGRGIASYALARAGFDVTALEPDPSPIVGAAAIRALASETNLPIKVVDGFSEEIPVDDGSFDVVFARAVLHHTRDLDRACRQIFRVLRDGGIFVGVREHVISKEADLPRFLDQHPLHRLYGGEHAFLLRRYMDALKGAGFAKVDVLQPLKSPINLFPYSEDNLRAAIAKKISERVPLGSVCRAALESPPLFSSLLAVAQYFDARPGRLYSFLCHKTAT